MGRAFGCGQMAKPFKCCPKVTILMKQKSSIWFKNKKESEII